METPAWQKALVVAGGAAAAAGLVWYLFREAEDAAESEEKGISAPMPAQHYFKVTDVNGCAIGIRQDPDVMSRRTGESVLHTETFGVSEIVEEEGTPQRYLRLADGRGWAFTHSPKDGRLLANEITSEQMMAEREAGPNFNVAMQQEMQRLLKEDPALLEQVLKSQEAQGMMADPDMLRQLAARSGQMTQVPDQNAALSHALASDPQALGAAFDAAAGTRSSPP